MNTLLIAAVLGNAFVVTEWQNPPASEFVVTEWAGLSPKRPDVLLATLPTDVTPDPLATADAAHTPMAEVIRVLDLLPRPQIGFVDFGCGYDARWCIAAAEKWGCRVTGIEIDPARATAARERVRNLGLSHLITIVEGDAGEVPVAADVGVAYLYQELLARLKPRLEALRAFASYLHQPAGLPVVKNGDSWVYRKPAAATVAATKKAAVWQGVAYTRPVCTNPGCAMCNEIRSQLASQPASAGHWVKRCNGRQCWMEWVPG